MPQKGSTLRRLHCGGAAGRVRHQPRPLLRDDDSETVPAEWRRHGAPRHTRVAIGGKSTFTREHLFSGSMLFASIILGIDNFGLSTLFARLHPALESLVPEVTKTRAARKSTSPRRLRFRELRSDGDVVHLDTPGCDWGGVNVPQRTYRVWEHVFFFAFANLGMHHLGLSTLFPPLHPVLECLVSRGCEDTRGTERDIATSVAFQRMADRCDSLRFDVLVSVVTLRDSAWGFLQASSHDGDDFCERHSREQMCLHFPLHAHERNDADAGEGTRRNQGRA